MIFRADLNQLNSLQLNNKQTKCII